MANLLTGFLLAFLDWYALGLGQHGEVVGGMGDKNSHEDTVRITMGPKASAIGRQPREPKKHLTNTVINFRPIVTIWCHPWVPMSQT